MYLFCACAVEELYGLSQLGAPDYGIVHKKELLSVDEFRDGGVPPGEGELQSGFS